ncbi:MAG: GrpB family protein [Deltaproteobacteria bacterium]|nr:GrpB family protein [Deltaproteobacteria bacterium]MBW1862324.1 GrpB family protein [Deltaproteobacteria bacterium]
MESVKQHIRRVTKEQIAIEPYNTMWHLMFKEEKEHLLSCLPNKLINRIEHFGSTAVPDLAAKPIIDMLVEVTSLEETKERIVPVLKSQGYDYFWRPVWDDDVPPFYAWFIKRDANGNRTHHIHMVEHNFEHWDRLSFRDYLIDHPATAKEYQKLKYQLAGKYESDRVRYTGKKTEFIQKITQLAKSYYGKT